MHHSAKILISIVIISLIALAGLSWAQGIKERMRDRLPIIVDLKARGVVGENNQGYLEMLKGQTEKQDIVAEENKDRRAVYETIAKQQGTTVELVGQRRALQIAEKASPGEWLQNANGNWHQQK